MYVILQNSWQRRPFLEVEADGRRHSAGSDVMGPAKGGKEVVERYFIGDVDRRQAKAPLALVAVEKVVVTYRQVEQAARRNTRRVVVVVLGSGRWDLDQAGPVLRCGAQPVGADRSDGSRVHAAAIESRLKLLIGRQVGHVHDAIRPVGTIVAIAAGARHGTRHQAAVVAPVEADPRSPLPWLVLQVSGFVEPLVVVDAEHLSAARDRKS